MSEEPNRIDDEEVDRLLAEQRRARLVRQRNIVLILSGAGLVVRAVAPSAGLTSPQKALVGEDVAQLAAVDLPWRRRFTAGQPPTGTLSSWPEAAFVHVVSQR